VEVLDCLISVSKSRQTRHVFDIALFMVRCATEPSGLPVALVDRGALASGQYEAQLLAS